MNTPRLNKIVVLIVALLISALFLAMIRQFLLTILLAGIFAGLLIPLFNRFQKLFGGRSSMSAGMTLLIFLLVVFLPLAGLLVVVAAQALSLSITAIPLIRGQLKSQEQFHGLFVQLPFYQDLEAYSDLILQKAGEFLGRMGSVLFESFSAFTYTAVYDIFLFFVFTYTMFFLLKDGHAFLERLQYSLPLNQNDQKRLLDKFLSVTRATLKGTLVIGVVQGSLAGLAFQVAGIDNAVFWGTVMAVLSVLPLIGSTLVWIPAVVFLAVSGQYVPAAGLFLFCSLVVGQIDNILRPILVGRDTQMHELFIFFGTLGGIGMFGAFGFIVGPVVAALFVTVWDIYGETFRDTLIDMRAGVPGAMRRSEDESADDLP
ncbi:MAG: AI-2E family transporter [Chlorobiaceae bacterium]|nr:AI-2E family transporter [Chlorobiaceae bacterium]